MRLVIVTLALVLVGRANAQPLLTWDAPEACPTAASVQSRIEERLGRPVDDVVANVRVEIAFFGSHFIGRVDVSGDVRILTSESCEELADAVAVIAARVAREQTRPTVPRPVIESPAPAPRAWSVDGRVAAVTGVGVVPSVGVGGELAVALRGRAMFVELAQMHWFPETIPSATFDIELDVTAARIGWRARLPVRVWVVGEGGTIRTTQSRDSASPSGIAVTVASRVDATQWLAAGAGGAVELRLAPWFRIVGAAETTYSTDRDIVVAGVVVYTPSRVSARASCGIEIGW